MKNKKIKHAVWKAVITAMLAVTMPLSMMTAWASNAKIAFSDPSASVGSEVNVTMKVTSTGGDALGRANIMLSYDPAALEFIKGTNASGGAGSISVKPSADGTDGQEMVCTLTFKALKAGTAKITVNTQEIYDSNEQLATLDRQGDSTITVNPGEGASSDATLKSLKVSPGALNPAFSASVEEYTVEVGTDVTRLAVSAEGNSANATISVEGDSDLQMGENTVTCRVTAEDGQSVKTYTIHVNKVEGGASEPVTAAGDLTAVINGEQYTVAASFDMAALPEGFEQMSYSYKGNDVMAARGTEKELLLLYLTDGEEKGDFFIYNEGADSWTPYMEISTTSKAVVILPVDDTVVIPDGFTEGIMNLENGRKASGWVPAGEENPKYWLFYGMNWNGEKALYRYDLEENTIQRYFQEPIGSNGTVSAEQYQEAVNANQELLHKYEMRGMILIALGALAAILLIAVIALALKKKGRESVRPSLEDKRRPNQAIRETAASEERRHEPGKEKKARPAERASVKAKKAVAPVPAEPEEDDFEMIDLNSDDDDGFEFIDMDDKKR